MSQRIDIMAQAFEDELRKIAAAKQAMPNIPKFVVPAAAGAVGFETLRRANQDRRLGRQVRVQQGNQGY